MKKPSNHKAALRGSRLRQKLRWAKEVHGDPVGASNQAWKGYLNPVESMGLVYLHTFTIKKWLK